MEKNSSLGNTCAWVVKLRIYKSVLSHAGMIKNIRFSFVFFLCIFLLFISKSFLWLDPDFGWHLRVGELILTEGFFYTDPFSYTMPSYPVIAHEWLIDVTTAFLYSHGGLLGLVLLYGCVGIAALWISSYRLPAFGKSLLVFLIGVIIFSFIGVRPQVWSWLFFAIELWLLSRWLPMPISGKSPKDSLQNGGLQYGFREVIGLIFLPVLFLFWANIHGGFVLGIGVLCLIFIIKMGQSRKISWLNLVIVSLAVGATGVTPYGFRMWWEVWMSMSDSSLHFTINEWLPAIFFVNFPMLIFGTLSVCLVIRYRKKFGVIEKVLYAALLLLGISSVRHLPFWLIYALPMTGATFALLQEEVVKIPLGMQRLQKAYMFFFGGVLLICLLPFIFQPRIDTASGYPQKTVQFLRKHPAPGNMLSIYNWGGYLIWQLPEKKVFIDGRMPSWRWDAPVGQEDNAFKTYKMLFVDKSTFTSIQTKYHIDTVLLERTTFHKDLLVDLDKWVSRTIFHKKSGYEMDSRRILKEAGFRKIYEDEVGVIYRRLE